MLIFFQKWTICVVEFYDLAPIVLAQNRIISLKMHTPFLCQYIFMVKCFVNTQHIISYVKRCLGLVNLSTVHSLPKPGHIQTGS